MQVRCFLTTVIAVHRDRVRVVVDGLVVLCLGGSALTQLWYATPPGLQGGRAVHAVLVVGFVGPLLLRRTRAVAALVLVVCAAWLQLELGGGLGQPFFAVLIALYSVGAYATYPLTLAGPRLLALQIVLVDIPRLMLQRAPVDEIIPAWFVLGGTWWFGRWMRRRRWDSRVLTERMEQVERDADAHAEQAVSDERARIARELHDLVAHSMGVIVILAQAAQRSLTSDPAAARSALCSIERSGREGLSEMRRLLDLLAQPSATSTSPQPRLDQLDDLLMRLRQAGLEASCAVAGQPYPLAPGIELAAYRIVQEALTNVLKHAPGAKAVVVVRYHPELLEVEVTNTGAAPTSGGPGGRGLVGMRERVAVYGGTIETAAQPGGGFRVTARLPAGRQL